MTEEAHAKLGPSSAARWMRCTKSPEMIEEHGIKGETNAASEEGTAAHTVLEMRMLQSLASVGFVTDMSRLEALEKEVAELGV